MLTRYQGNILMRESGVPILSSFDQTKALQYSFPGFTTSDMARMKGTINWIAPEMAQIVFDIIDGRDVKEIRYTKQTDMWAFGMVIYVSSNSSPILFTDWISLMSRN